MRYLILAALAANFLCSCSSRSIDVTFSGDWAEDEKAEFIDALNDSRYGAGAQWIETD